MATPTFTKAGAKATTAAKLNKDVFAVEVENHELVRQAYEMYLANGRTNNAKTKTRGLVRGGGRKPWRQKGTGRARFGSIRTPIWRGGGITFGPTGNENYSKSLNKKAKKLAVKQALSLSGDKIMVVDSLDFGGKTSTAAKFLKKIGAERSSLIVTAEADDMLNRATNNLESVKVVRATYLNVFDILNADHIILTKDGLAACEQHLGGTK